MIPSPIPQVKKLKPNISDIPKNTSVISGDPIVLKCPADGAPPPVFSWTKDGVDVRFSIGYSNPKFAARAYGP